MKPMIENVRLNDSYLENQRVDKQTGLTVYDVDYGEQDGSGSWSLRGLYCKSQQTLYYANVEASGNYANWDGNDFLKEMR